MRKGCSEASARSTDSWRSVSLDSSKGKAGDLTPLGNSHCAPFPLWSNVHAYSLPVEENIYIPFKIFPHFSSPSSPFSCLPNEFHHLVLSSPWALFQLSLCKGEPIAYQTQGQLYIKVLGSSIYGFRRLKAKPFKEQQQKWLQIQISLSAAFYFSFFLFYCEFINP